MPVLNWLVLTRSAWKSAVSARAAGTKPRSAPAC